MGCICESSLNQNPLVQNKVPTNTKKNEQVNQINPSNQNNQNFQTNITQIKQTNNNNIINNEENNLKKNNNININNNKPPLHQYRSSILKSTDSLVSNTSSEHQHEILINGERITQYSLKSGVLDNSGSINYLQNKDKYANENNVPLSESFSYFSNKNENKIDILNEDKQRTFVGTSKLNFPTMQSQTSKNSQYYFNKGKGNKINISLSGSGTGSGVYINYPNKDNTPIPDLENIDEKNIEQD